MRLSVNRGSTINMSATHAQCLYVQKSIHVLFKEPEDSKTFASNLNSQEYLNQLLLHTWLWLFGRLKPQASA